MDSASAGEEVDGRSELEVLLEQLDEILGEPIVHADDAVEVCTVGGLALRLGASESDLEDLRTWLEEGGGELAREGLEEADWEGMVEALDGLWDATDSDVEDRLSDFDDVVAACALLGCEPLAREHAKKVAKLIRTVPDPFAFMAATASVMLRCAMVGRDLELYDYWVAIAEAEAWS